MQAKDANISSNWACVIFDSFLDGGVAGGPVEVLRAADVLGQVIAPEEVSAVLLSKIIQLSGQQRLNLQ